MPLVMAASAITGDDLARSSPDVFNRSMRREEDENELQWAAIERLPTYDRMRKGVLRQVLDTGEVIQSEVDVRNLRMQDKKQLMERIFKYAEDDNEKFLGRLRGRIDW